MSWWTYISGVIKVSPMGRTQAEIRYILETVLDHLPRVTGSEGDMEVHIVQPNGYDTLSSCDEFQMITDNLVGRYGHKTRRGSLKTQDEYLLIVEASLRDRIFKHTYTEFQKWLCRLAKRVTVNNVLVEIKEFDRCEIITDKNEAYHNMFEEPSWCNNTGEPNWCEYLMWNRYGDYSIPLEHVVKYYNCDEADEEWERRFKK